MKKFKAIELYNISNGGSEKFVEKFIKDNDLKDDDFIYVSNLAHCSCSKLFKELGYFDNIDNFIELYGLDYDRDTKDYQGNKEEIQEKFISDLEDSDKKKDIVERIIYNDDRIKKLSLGNNVVFLTIKEG